jgi:hypothetical protein
MVLGLFFWGTRKIKKGFRRFNENYLGLLELNGKFFLVDFTMLECFMRGNPMP